MHGQLPARRVAAPASPRRARQRGLYALARQEPIGPFVPSRRAGRSTAAVSAGLPLHQHCRRDPEHATAVRLEVRRVGEAGLLRGCRHLVPLQPLPRQHLFLRLPGEPGERRRHDRLHLQGPLRLRCGGTRLPVRQHAGLGLSCPRRLRARAPRRPAAVRRAGRPALRWPSQRIGCRLDPQRHAAATRRNSAASPRVRLATDSSCRSSHSKRYGNDGMSLMWMPPQTTRRPCARPAAPRAQARPTGAKMIAASSASGGPRRSRRPRRASERAKPAPRIAGSSEREHRRPCCRATCAIRCAAAPKPYSRGLPHPRRPCAASASRSARRTSAARVERDPAQLRAESRTRFRHHMGGEAAVAPCSR